MRQKLRIPIVIDIFRNNTEILLKFLNTKDIYVIDKIYDNWNLIEHEWEGYPDLRFGQLLVNMNLVSGEIGEGIWNIEEDDWLFKNNYCDIQNIKFWGVNYYKNGKKRNVTKFVLLKDLKTDHIENIIKFFKDQNILPKLNKEYLEYFTKRINEDN